MPAPKGNDFAKGNKGGGRPSEYKDEYSNIAYRMALLGATDEELALAFDVSEQTINNWKKQYEDFSLSLKKGKQYADIEVAESLFKRAKGYRYKEIHSSAIKIKGKETDDELHDPDFIPDSANGFTEIKVIEKEVSPDVTAQIFWLKNRQPTKWKDKQDHEHSGEIKTGPSLTQEQIDKLVEKL